VGRLTENVFKEIFAHSNPNRNLNPYSNPNSNPYSNPKSNPYSNPNSNP